MDAGHAQAHLLQARICLEREHYRAASACLDLALSHDFSIRQSLSYFIIKAKLLETSGDVRDALQTLQAAMKMLQATAGTNAPIRRKGASSNASAASSAVPGVSLFDKASVYIQMAQVLSQLNDIAEATKIVREALQVFRCVLRILSLSLSTPRTDRSSLAHDGGVAARRKKCACSSRTASSRSNAATLTQRSRC